MFNRNTTTSTPAAAPTDDAETEPTPSSPPADGVALSTLLPEVAELGIETLDQLAAWLGASRVWTVAGVLRVTDTAGAQALGDALQSARTRRAEAYRRDTEKARQRAELAQKEAVLAEVFRERVTATMLETGMPYWIACEMVNGERPADGWRADSPTDDYLAGGMTYRPINGGTS